MTSLRDFLEDFGAPATVPDGPQMVDSGQWEAQRLEAYESGYKAGWEDAIRAQSDDSNRISSAFGQHLQDLSFTYHEAYSRVMNAMSPLLKDIVATLLPGMAQATLGAHIVEELNRHAEAIGALHVIIAVAPSRTQAVSPLVEGDFGFPIRLVADDTLSEDQADIRFGDAEWQIDLGALIEKVAEAVDGFAHDNLRKISNG